MNVIVFGAAGQVGSACVNALIETGYEVLAVTRQDVDFSHVDNVREFVVSHPADIIVNACAYTAVDKAESEPELANAVNHLSVAAIAAVCHQKGIPLVHISTDYVFDGSSTQPYQESDPVNPLGVYGATKLAGEKAIQRIMDHYIILRTSWVFGELGHNFVKTMLRVGAEKEELSVVDDQFGCPTYVGDIVDTILFFVDRCRNQQDPGWGVYHCVNQDQTSWYLFAKTIFEIAAEKKILPRMPLLHAISTDQYPTAAARPAYSVMATAKLNNLRGKPLPHWRDGLEKFLTHQALQQSL